MYWYANSLDGTNTSEDIHGVVSERSLNNKRGRARSDNKTAKLLPEPVCARKIISRGVSRAGIKTACTDVGAVMCGNAA